MSDQKRPSHPQHRLLNAVIICISLAVIAFAAYFIIDLTRPEETTALPGRIDTERSPHSPELTRELAAIRAKRKAEDEAGITFMLHRDLLEEAGINVTKDGKIDDPDATKKALGLM